MTPGDRPGRSGGPRGATGLTTRALAARSGSTPGRIRRLVSIGVLRPDERGRFEPADVQRIQIIDAYERAGIQLEHIARAVREGRMSFEFTDRIYPAASPASGRSMRDLVAELGAAGAHLSDVFLALGRPQPDPDRPLTEADELVLRQFARAWLADPMSAAVALRAARLVGDATRRVASGWVGLFLEGVALPDDARLSMSVDELRPRLFEPAIRVAGALEPTVTWMLRYHLEQALNAANVEAMERALAAAGERQRAADPPAIVFADLSGFTRLTEEEGDELAARHAEALAAMAMGIATTHGGRLVKHLGDGVMLAFAAAGPATAAAEALCRAARATALPPLHVGISAGPMIERDGDYYGRTVNLASRLSGVAGPGEIVLNDVAAAHLPRERVTSLPPVELKGLGAPITVFRLEPGSGSIATAL